MVFGLQLRGICDLEANHILLHCGGIGVQEAATSAGSSLSHMAARIGQWTGVHLGSFGMFLDAAKKLTSLLAKFRAEATQKP